MLRYYAEIGLILPDKINPENGYRYYFINQLEKMLLINRLKAYCFSLEEIKSIFESEEVMDEVLFIALNKKKSKPYVMFIASIVRNYIFRGLKKVSEKEKDRKNYTVPDAISELEKITIVKNSRDVYIRRYGLTKKRKNILRQFGVTESYINQVADRMNSRISLYKKRKVKEIHTAHLPLPPLYHINFKTQEISKIKLSRNYFGY